MGPAFFANKVAPKDNLNLKNILSIQTIDGFSTPSPFRGFEEGYLRSKFLLDTKDNLLQNKLRQYFYNNGLTPLPNFLKLAPNVNTYKSVLNLLLDKDFLSNQNSVLEQDNKSQNPVVTNQQEITPLKDKSKLLLAHPSPGQRDISSKLQEYCSEQILQVLQNFGPFKINVAIQPRLMSGYEFPDTSNIEVRSLILQHFYQTTISSNKNPLVKHKKQNKFKVFSPILKVELPPSFTSYLNYNYYNSKTPSFKLNYRPTFLQGVKKIRIVRISRTTPNKSNDQKIINKICI